LAKEMGEKQLFGITIAIVVLVLLVVGVFTFLGYRRFGMLSDEIQDLDRKIKTHGDTCRRKKSLELKMQGMKSNFENVRQYLPDDREVAKLIKAFHDKCIEAKLNVAALKKSTVSAGRGRGRGRQAIQVEKIQYKGKFTGTFHSLARFVSMVEDWEHFKRFVSITDFEIKAANKGMDFDSGAQLHKISMLFELYKYQLPKRAAARKAAAAGAPK
jgi:Tfp pilus assembly protein PilO